MIRVLRVILVLVFPHVLFAQYQSTLEVNSKKIALKVEGDIQFKVGQKIPISVKIIAKKETDLYDLKTGYLRFELCQYDGSGYVPVKYNGVAATGGGYRIATYVGVNQELETIREELPQTLITLDKGQLLEKKYELLSLFGSYQWAGQYKLSVKYESQLKAEKVFTIEFGYENAVEHFLSFLSKGVFFDDYSTLNTNYYLLAYPEEKRYYGPDSLHYQQAPILRAWWEDHKELILKVESVLNRVKYKGMRYENRVPKLLKKLEKGEYQERLEARNELYEIVGKPEWKPSASDIGEESQARVKELVDWWKENKGLVSWVNRVIIENQSK